jgi:phosphonoacetaldehyde hydrolase
MNNKIEAIVFDWAGTTVDFGSFAPVQAFIEAFKEFGIEVTVEEVRKPMGMLKREHIKTMMSMDRINNLWIEKYSQAWNDDDIDKVYELTENKIFEVVQQFSNPKPYVVETVNKLREMNIKIGSTTGYTDDMMKIVVPKAKELGYEVDCYITPNSTNNIGRPYPYMIYKNMEALNVLSVKNVIKVGDTVVDVKEGKNAGVISIGVIDGSSEMALCKEEFDLLSESELNELRAKIKERYIEAGADYVINDIRDILKFI